MIKLQDCDKIIICAGIIAIIFIFIGHIFQEQIQEVFKQPILTLENKIVFDWWSVMHFLLFALFGFVKPYHAFSFFLIGGFFELIEDMLASDENTQIKTNNKLLKPLFCNGIQDGYWYAKADDLFSNLLGYTFGQAIKTTFF